ncbi:TadE/TadG family type IV pilus assembly protein [Novipirellula artificiosorum]|uniref:TadE-like protein n=1 Tax=Novipirellula artificiosorum TaxID=2528016 RepID=A0A5C6DVQ3_9BACT|nr:TadE family protein [Novipirellula artificiosorum]TWU40718.1 TadE-like protein [Novipirellula artificiosorum]
MKSGQPIRVKYRQTAKRQGAVMVEFAIVVPLLFLFFFAAFEFCRASMIRHTADNAVYEAARTGIIPGSTAADAQQTAEAIMSSLGVTNVNVQVTPSTIDRDTREITVRVNVPLSGNSFVPINFIHGDITRELTMRREGAS